MGNPRARKCFALVAAVASAFVFGTLQQASADGWQSGEPGRWVPGTPMTDSQNVTDWSGFYIGGKLGGVWSDIGWAPGYGDFVNGGAVPVGTDATFSPSSFAGGVFGGANLQMGNWVFGLEFSYTGGGLGQTTASPYFPATDTFKTELDWLLMVEPRLGYSWDRTMVFIKGGWAGGNATFNATQNDLTPASVTATDFVDGWTLGGGVEYALWPSFIVGVDYQYVNLNLSTAASCDLCLIGIPIGEPPAVNGNATLSQVMLRASYLFRPED
ncbi:MAG: outer membrane beta-barrel protein [Hyphomicrobium sp.]|jgi:outer membrane immunogenic protein